VVLEERGHSNHCIRIPFSCKATSDGKGGPSETTSRYEDSSAASKGIVTSLTSMINSLSDGWGDSPAESAQDDDTRNEASGCISSPPSTPQELAERIRQDYTVKNYLWTGDIDLGAFDKDCTFTDPTISFTGRDQFVRNIQNLRPLVDALIIDKENGCSSILLDIELREDEGYVQTRWNMVGSLSRLPWQPRIDVIGRTKFWFNKMKTTSSSGNEPDGSIAGYQVVEYDEEWEIPAGKALLQLVTPPGTIANTQ